MAGLIMRQDWIFYREGDKVRFNSLFWDTMKDAPNKPESGGVYRVMKTKDIPVRHQPTFKHNQFLLLEGYTPDWSDKEHPPWISGGFVELVRDRDN